MKKVFLVPKWAKIYIKNLAKLGEGVIILFGFQKAKINFSSWSGMQKLYFVQQKYCNILLILSLLLSPYWPLEILIVIPLIKQSGKISYQTFEKYYELPKIFWPQAQGDELELLYSTLKFNCFIAGNFFQWLFDLVDWEFLVTYIQQYILF